MIEKKWSKIALSSYDYTNITWSKFFELINDEAEKLYEEHKEDTIGLDLSDWKNEDIFEWLFDEHILSSDKKYTIDEYMHYILDLDEDEIKNRAWNDFNRWRSSNKTARKIDKYFSLAKYFYEAGKKAYGSVLNLHLPWNAKYFRCKRCGYIACAESIDKVGRCPKCGANDWEPWKWVGTRKGLWKAIKDPFVNLVKGSKKLLDKIYDDVTSFDYIKFARRQVRDILKAFLRAFSVEPITFFCCALVSIWEFEEREAKEHGWKFGPKIEDVRKYVGKFITILELLLGIEKGLLSTTIRLSLDVRGLLNWVFKVMWLGTAIIFIKNLVQNSIKTAFMKIIANIRRNAESPTVEGALTNVLLDCTMFLEFLSYLESKLLAWNRGLFGLLYKYYRQLFKLLLDFRAGEVAAFDNLLELSIIASLRSFLLSLLEMGYAIAICIGADRQELNLHLPSYYFDWDFPVNPFDDDPVIDEDQNNIDIRNWYIDTADLHPEDKEKLLKYVVVPVNVDIDSESINNDVENYIKSFELDIKTIKKFM